MSFEGSYRALGFDFRIRTNGRRIGLMLDRLFAPFREPIDDFLPTYFILEEDERATLVMAKGWIREAPRAVELIDYVMWDVHMEAIRHSAPLLALHAAAASLEGEGVIIAGPQESGKSTLVAGLTAAGFDYLTDESALVDLQTGLIHPFPKALSLDRSSVDLIPGLLERLPSELRDRPRAQYHVAPDHLRLGSIGNACPPSRIIFPKYEPEYEEDETLMEPVSRGWALNALVRESFNFGHYGAAAISALAALVSDAECFRIRMGNLDEAVSLLTYSESPLAEVSR